MKYMIDQKIKRQNQYLNPDVFAFRSVQAVTISLYE